MAPGHKKADAPKQAGTGVKSRHSKTWTFSMFAAAFAVACLAVLYNPQYVQESLVSVPLLDNLSMRFESIAAQFPDGHQFWEMMPAFHFGSGDPAVGSEDDVPPSERPGLKLAAKGLKPKHPVIIVPGFVTSGLELWTGKPCGQKYFRQRMWGTMTMMQLLLRDTACWFEHMALDPKTGLDPEGIKMRAALGLEAVDYFVQGYWVWGKLVQALADVGYDPNNLVCEAFDWRLSIPNMELRDGYFTRLRASIETAKTMTAQKVVLVSHSYGENVVRAFYAWVELQDGAGWVEANLEAHVAIAGVALGLPKAITSMLSGELRDTAQLGPLTGYLMNNIIPRESRAKLWRTWGSLIAMMPVGGTRVWGNSTWAPDDDDNVRKANRTFGAFIAALPAAKRVLDQKDLDSHGDTGASGGPVPAPSGSNTTGYMMWDTAAAAVTNTGLSLTESIKSWFPAEAGQYNASITQRLDVDAVVGVLHQVTGRYFASHYRLAGPQPPPMDQEALSEELLELVGGAQANQATTKEGSPAKGERHALVFFPDASRHPLPDAPSLSTYCLYGHGLPTERAYHYLEPDSPNAGGRGVPPVSSATILTDQLESGSCAPGGDLGGADTHTECVMKAGSAGGADDAGGGGAAGNGSSAAGNWSASGGAGAKDNSVDGSFEWRINTAAADPDSGLDHGVQMGPGDGTVPLLSLGAMCRGGWMTKKLNPSSSRVVTREYQHNPTNSVIPSRGGPGAADHVDILGNEGVLIDVIMVATGRGAELQTRLVSNIDDIVDRIDWS